MPNVLHPGEITLAFTAPVELTQEARRRAVSEEMNLSSALRRLLLSYAAGEVDAAGVPDPRVDRRLRQVVKA